jgi:hypothetical protein
MHNTDLTRRHALQTLAMGASVTTLVASAIAAEEPRLKILSPLEERVFQRRGYVPALGRYIAGHAEGQGAAEVPIVIECRIPEARTFDLQIIREPGQFGDAPLRGQPVAVDPTQQPQTVTLTIPAGGWYRIEVAAVDATGQRMATATINRIGVGEVFLIAGQSYAGNHNDELLKVADPHGRAVAWDAVTQHWTTAHDPQPTTTGAAGSLWPALADLLLPTVQTPISFVNVSVGGSASRQWLPDAQLFPRLPQGMAAAGEVRAILWQQGESDVLEKTPAATYVARMKTIRETLVARTQQEVPWLLAKSTHHPTVYDDAVLEGQIRSAIDELWTQPGFARGPDTDILVGADRGPLGTQRHFTGPGQRTAALLWFAAIWDLLRRGTPGA